MLFVNLNRHEIKFLVSCMSRREGWNQVFNHFVFKNKGFKHDFLFINIRKVLREVLKTEGEAKGFQPSQGTLQMLMNDKIMFDRYYCINSTKTLRK